VSKAFHHVQTREGFREWACFRLDGVDWVFVVMAMA
jgi:hypothetical protein